MSVVCMCGNNKQSSASASAKVKIFAGLEPVLLVLEHCRVLSLVLLNPNAEPCSYPLSLVWLSPSVIKSLCCDMPLPKLTLGVLDRDGDPQGRLALAKFAAIRIPEPLPTI